MDRNAALDRVDAVIDVVESGTLPIPVREIWVYSDVAFGLNPLDRLDVCITKDILLRGDPDAAESFERSHGVRGVDKSVHAKWTHERPDLLRANANGHAAPEKCLAAHLFPDKEPVHLKIYNVSFEDNVTRRLKGAVERKAYEQILDPRDVCFYADGQRSSNAMSELRDDEFAFPTLSGALEMLGSEDGDAETAVKAIWAYRAEQTDTSIHGGVA